MRTWMISIAIATVFVAVSLGKPIALVVRAQDTKQAEPAAANAAAQADEATKQSEQNIQAMAQRLVAAMDQLIPGEFAADAPLPKQLQEAATLLLRGDPKTASENLEKLVNENPTLPPWPLLLAAMHFSMNQAEPGRLGLERAAVDFPDYPGVYTALARLSINEGWWASSMALLAQLRQKIDSGTWSDEQKKHFDLEYLDALSDTAIGQRRLEDARKHLTELQGKLPENASVPFRLGDIDFRQEKFDDSLENLAKARALDATLYPPELVLYQWSTRQNKTEDAERWIKSAAEKFPEEKIVQVEYSRFLLERAELAEAAKWIERAEKSGANSAITRFLKAQISFLRRSYTAAEADFNELALQNPNDIAVRNMLALCLIESDDPVKQQKAIEIASTNLRFNPNNAQLASTMGWVFYRLGNTQQAKQILSQVASLPNFPSDTGYYMAQMLMDEGNDEGAAKLLTDCLNARGLFSYRLRAEADLNVVNKRLANKKDATKEPAPSNDKR